MIKKFKIKILKLSQKNQIFYLSLNDINIKSFFISIYNFYFKKKRIVKLEGGIGDLIYNLILLQKTVTDLQYKNIVFEIFYDDDNIIINDKKNHSLGSLRLMQNDKNEIINFRKEIIEQVIDNKRITFKGGDLKKIYGESWFPDNFWSMKIQNPSIKDFKELFLNKITNDYSSDKINSFFIKNKIKYKYRICLHIRRSSKEIIKLANNLNFHSKKINKDIHFILLGSSEHDEINLELINFKYTSLIDSYKKGFKTIDILNFIQNCNFYIGGRGGFELFSWYSSIPTLNFFDDRGFREINNNSFPIKIIRENRFKDSLVDRDNFMIDELSNSLIKFINNDKI